MKAVVLGSLAVATVHSQPTSSPISRVVQLLEGLTAQTESDGKKEKELYESFVCWAQSVVKDKTATNSAANARISELETYIADIDAGRVEFTTERQDLTKELEEIKGDIQAMTLMRNTEHSEFLSAEDELKKAVAALQMAISVLADATAGHEEGVFAQAQMHESLSERMKDADALHHAVELGSKMLTAGDAMFLRRLLTGDVPTHDWKKLNRKADFKTSYKMRSNKIQEVLANMEATFSASLGNARDKEASALAQFNTLVGSKRAQESAASEALLHMESEMGARGLTKEQSQAEVDSLKTQVSNDVGFIQQTNNDLATKKEEWKDRQALRAAELAAFSKAIAILHNDAARDNMKRSFQSQGYSLAQVNNHDGESAAVARRESAASVLQRAGRRAGDGRLVSLALRLGASHFTEVVSAIDSMVTLLKGEEVSDLEKKETCEANRATDTRSAILNARAIDDSSDLITKLSSEVAALEVEIKDKEDTIAKIQEELAEARRLREDEKAAWSASDKDDTDAATTVKSARDVLSNFYADNNLMLVQRAPVVEAGKAPPPPPQTWDAPYGGKTEQATGIVSILDMLVEDINQDKAKAKASEDAAQSAFNTFETESNAQVTNLQNDITALQGNAAAKQLSKEQEITTRGITRGELAVIMQTIRDAEPGCDYWCANYPMRLQNRQIEIDGLRKAKSILEGAVYDAPDPNRELTPGDAFLLRRRRHA